MLYCLSLKEVLHIVTAACTVVICTFTLFHYMQHSYETCVVCPPPYKERDNLSRSPCSMCACMHMHVRTGQTYYVLRWQQF